MKFWSRRITCPKISTTNLRANADALEAGGAGGQGECGNGAKLQLAYCTIKSPIDGRVGSVLINKGNVVKANDVAMVTINKITPIYVTLSVPEQNLSEIKKYMAEGLLKVEAVIPGDEKHPDQGVLTFINNAVDITTGTIQLKATFENKDKRFGPDSSSMCPHAHNTANAVVMPSAACRRDSRAGMVCGQARFYGRVPSNGGSRTFADLAVVAQGLSRERKSSPTANSH